MAYSTIMVVLPEPAMVFIFISPSDCIISSCSLVNCIKTKRYCGLKTIKIARVGKKENDLIKER
jgi:hypothetical protein